MSGQRSTVGPSSFPPPLVATRGTVAVLAPATVPAAAAVPTGAVVWTPVVRFVKETLLSGRRRIRSDKRIRRPY